MQLNALRAGWPEQILTGQYGFRAHTQSGAVDVMAWMIDLVTDSLIEPDGAQSFLWLTVDGRTIGTVLKDSGGVWPPAGVKVVADNPRGPLVTLLRHAQPRVPGEPSPADRVITSLFDRRRTVRSRFRRAASELRYAMFRLKPPPMPPTWDVLDNRLGIIIGRLHAPIGGSAPPGTRLVLFGSTGRFAAHLVERPGLPARYLMFVAGGREVARVVQQCREYHVDVALAGPAGLDPRLVLACAALELSHLSSN